MEWRMQEARGPKLQFWAAQEARVSDHGLSAQARLVSPLRQVHWLDASLASASARRSWMRSTPRQGPAAGSLLDMSVGPHQVGRFGCLCISITPRGSRATTYP
eukprot:1810835-Pyramimonas_sp.AAC.1